MRLTYHIYRPGGNDTALVEGLIVDEAQRKAINDEILAKHRNIEQVGFLAQSGRPQLLMAGGEFCGNASRCAAWHYLSGCSDELTLAVCAGDKWIKAGVTETATGSAAWAEIPLLAPPDESVRQLSEKIYAVKLAGISHLVIYDQAEDPKTAALAALAEYPLNDEPDCRGVIFVAGAHILPVVEVVKLQTLNLETACGSGSLAVALVAYFKSQNAVELKLQQPSGQWIDAKVNAGSACISGPIQLLGHDEIEIKKR